MILLAVPALSLVAVTVAAFFGRWSWVLDVLANFRVQYAVALFAMAALLFLGRWRRTATVVLAGALVNAVVVAPLFWGASTGEPSGTLTVLSFNLKASNERFGEVISYLREVDADVVFLHEASRPWEVAMENSGLGYEIVKSRSEELIFGTLVLTSPGDDVTSYGFTSGGARAVQVVHDGVAMLGIHPLAPTTAERAALRNGQLKFAGEWAGDQVGPHVVVGDFNATPWSYPFRRLLAETDMRNSQRGFGIDATFPTVSFFAFRVPIDHLVYSEGLVVLDRHIGPDLGSDHFPLVVELGISVDGQ